MEANFNFNSQVCTNKVQSERLLALSLKKETADMSWSNVLNDGNREWMLIPLPIGAYTDTEIPAWSLHRLIEICGKDRLPISFHKKGKVKIRVNHIHPTHDGRSNYNYYDSIIDCIEWLIKKGCFNKDYLV